MKPTIVNRKEMGLVPGSWAWMKHQLENAEITFSVEIENTPMFKCRFPDVRAPFVCFSPTRTHSADKAVFEPQKPVFYCKELQSPDSYSPCILKWCTPAASDLFYSFMKDWAAYFYEIIE